MNPSKKSTVRKTISIPETLLEQGQARAADDNRDFSNYVQNLIQKDLASKNTPLAEAHAEIDQ